MGENQKNLTAALTQPQTNQTGPSPQKIPALTLQKDSSPTFQNIENWRIKTEKLGRQEGGNYIWTDQVIIANSGTGVEKESTLPKKLQSVYEKIELPH